MKFDRTSLGKSVMLMAPDAVATATDAATVSTAIATDTTGYESCVITFALNGLGNNTDDTGVAFTITEAATADGDYSAVDVDRVISDDATYTATSKVLTVSAADVIAGTLVARVGVILTKPFVKVTISNPLAAAGDAIAGAAIVAELGNPTYSTDYFSLDAKPSQA